MSSTQLEVMRGRHFAGADIGPLDALDQYRFFHPLGKGRGLPGKLFLRAPLEMSGMEVSLNKLPAGAAVPFHHRHREHEELYIFLKGRGQFMVDGTVIDVGEGSVIRIAPDGMRTWRNLGPEDLYYIVVQARAGSLAGSDIEDGVICSDPVSWPA